MIANPLVTPTSRSRGAVVQSCLLGYGHTGGADARSARDVARHRPKIFHRHRDRDRGVADAELSSRSKVRTIYHGPVLDEGPTTEAEQYTYSVVWLAYGVALLGGRHAGCARSPRGSPRPRSSSSPSVKVFLIDMAA